MAFTETNIAISSLAALPAAAEQVRALLGDHTIVLFEGEMGAGKTTFIKAFCETLGVPAAEVSSPTFSLVNEYRDARNQPIYHFDFYRLDNSTEALAMGALEYFDSGYLCLVEWPSRVADLLPAYHLLVTLTVNGEEARILQVKTMN